MIEAYRREIALIGEENFAKLRAAHVYVFGIGGVGSFAAEALVRAGVGRLTFVDGDAVAESNLNRQLVALRSTLGKNKARVMAERAQDIRRIVLVQHVFVIFPDVDVLLAHAEQHGDILLADDVPLAEHRVLGHPGDDLGDVVAEHLPDCILYAHQFHG